MKYESLDMMLGHGVDKMYGDSWMREEVYVQCAGDAISTRLAWDELSPINGYLKYRGRVFVVSHSAGSRGMGGMDEGSPPSVTVYLIPEGK